LNKLLPLLAFSILLLVPVDFQNAFAGPGVADLDYTIDSAVFDSNTNTITIQATIVHNSGDTVGPAIIGLFAFPSFNLELFPDTQPFQWDSCSVDEPGLFCEAPNSNFPDFASTGVILNVFDGFSSGESFTFTATGSLTGQANSISFFASLRDPSGSTTDPDGLNGLFFDVITSEVCDNGVDDDLDGDVDCNDSDCSLDPVCNTDICGDGIVEGTEQCDSLNPPLPTTTCDINCQLIAPPFCGDGLVNAPGEQCDSLNPPLPTTTCDISCMTIPPSCGPGTTLNGITNECDPDVTQADLDSVKAQRDAILTTLFEFLRVFGVI